MKEWFKARNIWGKALGVLSDDDAGKLVKAIWQYTMTGEEAELPDNLQGYYVMMLLSIKQDEEKEDEISAKRSNAGSKGGNQRVANQAIACDASIMKANQANASERNRKSKENEELFLRFWEAYPRHVNKPSAKKAFDKLKPNEGLLAVMLNAIEKQKASAQWSEDDGKFIPHPATWLNGKRWEDEVKQGSTKAVSAQGYEQRDYSGEQDEATRRMIKAMLEGA